MDNHPLNAQLTQQSKYSPFSVFLVTQNKVSKMRNADIIWNHTIVRGHVQVWAGMGNAGKTTIAMQAASDIAKDGYDVSYFQEDMGGSDVPALFEHSNIHGYKLLNSALAGQSAIDIVAVLEDLAKSQDDLSNEVYFFDTLKKFCDLMAKGGSRKFFTLMRSLSTLGATIVLLGHTNKHLGTDGKPIFEGVGDIRNDVDELFYVIRTATDENGICLVGITPDKQRAFVKETSFKLNTNTRAVIPVEMKRSIAEIKRIQELKSENSEVIDYVNGYLDKHIVENLTALAELVAKECKRGDRVIGLHKAREIIRALSSEQDDDLAIWLRTQLGLHNAVRISKKNNP